VTQNPHNSALVPPGQSRAGYNHALVLAPSPSPTLEYYSSHVADKVPSGNIETCYASRPCVKRPKLQPGTWVVIFRHAHPSWLRFILSRREELSRVTWFLDDDIPAMLWQRSLPTVYVWKSYVRYLHVKEGERTTLSRQRNWLRAFPTCLARYGRLGEWTRLRGSFHCSIFTMQPRRTMPNWRGLPQ
jgi:hypothetical protein